MGFTMGNVVAISNRTEERTDFDIIDNIRRVLAAGTDGEFDSFVHQGLQGLSYDRRNILFSHIVEIFAVQGVFILR